MSDQPTRIRQGRESQTASARRERAAAQLASTQGRGQGRGRRVRVPQDLVESSSASGSRSRLARVSSSRQREEEDEDEEEEEVIPDVDPLVGEEEEQEEQEVDSFPGGPFDTSLLIHYQDHVARRIWEGEVFFFNLAVYLSPFFIILPFISRLFVFFNRRESH